MLSIRRRGPDERTVNNGIVRIDLWGSGVHRFVRDQTAPGGPPTRPETGHELRIIRGSDRIQRIFALTDLDARLPFCDEDA